MLPFSPEPSVLQAAKCFFSHGTMGHIDPAQPPAIESVPVASSLSSKDGLGHTTRLKKPWSSIQALGFVSQLDIVMPQDSADALWQNLSQVDVTTKETTAKARPVYARVVMTLGQVLEGAFFTEYVKAGNILMLSQGRLGQDNVFTLKDGRLTLFLERESYERAGLVGKPHGAKGGRGLRPRWVVEFDLNAQAMCAGKPGFERLRYACKNVFDTPVTWLFYNRFDTPSPDPLSAFTPKIITAQPIITKQVGVALPPLGRPASLLTVADASKDADTRLEMDEAVGELYEWLSLVRLNSPRVEAADNIDPYLSRYQVPAADDDAEPATSNICTIRWRGFFSPTWACQLLLDVLQIKPTSASGAWFALSVAGFSGSKGVAGDSAECTFFRPEDVSREFLLWDVHSHE